MPRINSYDPNYNLRSVFDTEVEKVEQEQLFHLVQLDLPTDATANPTGQPFRIVDANHDVVFGWPGDNEATKPNYTYARFPVKFSPAEVNADGSISKASITIANVSREIMYYVEHLNGLRGCRLHIKTAYAGALFYLYSFGADGSVTETINPSHNPSACLHDEYLIDNYTANEQTVVFQLDPIIDLEIRIPRRRYMVDSCFWEFSGPGNRNDTCGYQGVETSCTKNMAACKAKGNQARFGGFPGISGSRRIYL